MIKLPSSFINMTNQLLSKGRIPLIENSETPWTEHDRKWFTKHPHRKYRVRKPFPNERYNPEHNCVVVHQIEPGARLRKMIKLEGQIGDFTEVSAKLLYDQVLGSDHE